MEEQEETILVVGVKQEIQNEGHLENKDLKSDLAAYIDKHIKAEEEATPLTKVQEKTECKLCNKVVVRKHFKQHALIHSEERKYQCSNCEKAFTLPHDLKRHNRIHTGERPFECYKCEKRFRVNAYLKTHLMIHEGVKPFKCNTCGQDFTQSSDMKRHMLKHNIGEYKCDMCSKVLSNSENLKKHRKLMHIDDRKNSCKLCGKVFASKCCQQALCNSSRGGKEPPVQPL